jgi:uncharacterized protein
MRRDCVAHRRAESAPSRLVPRRIPRTIRAMKSKVWFAKLKDRATPEVAARKAVELADAAGLKDLGGKSRLVAILQHVGEGRGTGYVKPAVTRALAERLVEVKARPFLTGSSTLYKGRRSNARDHLLQAYEHGFTPEAIGCPMILCDGLRGADRVEVEVPGARHCRVAYLGSGVAQMEGLVAVTHPTGHIAAGFGAAIKNVAMGLADRGGKMAMHHGGHPDFLPKKCTACGRCAASCPEDAITIGKTAELEIAKCIGCGQCYAVCPSEAIDFEWTHSGLEFQERLVDYCSAVRAKLGDGLLYLNVCQHFTKDCDCFDILQDALCPDIGILASRDLVAIDAATADLIKQAAGRDLVREAGKREYQGMLAYAEEQGLGRRDYTLVEL